MSWLQYATLQTDHSGPTKALSHLYKAHVSIQLQHILLARPQLLCHAACSTRACGSQVVAAHLTHLHKDQAKDITRLDDRSKWLALSFMCESWLRCVICLATCLLNNASQGNLNGERCAVYSARWLEVVLTCVRKGAVLLPPATLTKCASATGSTCHTTPTNTRCGCAALRNRSLRVH